MNLRLLAMRKQKIISNLLPSDFEDYIRAVNSGDLSADMRSPIVASISFVSNLLVDLKADKITISELKRALSITASNNHSACNDNKSVANNSNDSTEDNAHGKADVPPKRSRKGGKRSFDDYKNVTTERVSHESLSKGDLCPGCGMGKLYTGPDGKVMCFDGDALLKLSRYLIECLRCNSCGASFKARFNKPKWSNSARTTCILSRLNGLPFYRTSKMQAMYGLPVSNSTIWLQCSNAWRDVFAAIYDELLSEISACNHLYCDDTGAKILEYHDSDKACHTTIVCGHRASGEELLLYLTKNGYCGENIAPLMRGYKNLMSDASAMNIPHVDEEQLSKIVQFNCLFHGRAKFSEIRDSYHRECDYFLEQISQIYEVDRQAKNMSAKARLKLHKRLSWPYIKNIYRKIDELFKNKLIEPNSRLGSAMQYWRNHKKGLTRFLRRSGVALDNNISERNLKSMILQRKNSLFFATGKSAMILSGLASIAFTCQANNINAADYFNWVQDNMSKAVKDASSYMPWKYRDLMNNTERIAA